MKTEYSVYSKFDLEKHKQTFINYCEVVILPSGEIQYAVPSHQEKLIELMNQPRDVIMDMIPREYYGDVLGWLILQTNCISVWSGFYLGKPTTEAQKIALDSLIENKLTRRVCRGEF